MSDLLRSAFNYFTQASPTATVSGCKTDHPLVGTAVEVGGLRLKIRSLLAEGGYALVFSAQDAQGNWFALKRQLAADRDAANAVIREIRFLRELTGHPAIIRYVQAAHLGPQESGHGRAEFLMLTELCSGHPAIIRYVQAAHLGPQESGHGRAEFLMLTELCSGWFFIQLIYELFSCLRS
uniref:Protein kinase domain-containing protein n=1 Tax=Ascaris lumbricoides TaxID=6252 RepID=A0A0M3ITW1_ASCLU